MSATLGPPLILLLFALLGDGGGALGSEKQFSAALILSFAVVITAWTAAFTLTIGCVIVMLMKGPAYAADEYPLPDAEQPRRDREA